MEDPHAGRTHGVFAYGSLMAPAVLDHLAVHHGPARLRGWARSWSVCTDNVSSLAVRYLTPGTQERPAVQVLFLNLVPDPAAAVSGVLVHVAPHRLSELDAREGNYARVDVTASVSTMDGVAAPRVVWAYVGRPEPVDRARRGLAAGTARIRREYLDGVLDAFAAHHLLRDLHATLEPPPAPVVSLDRRVVVG
jgi:cation transport regulator ChaC